MNITGANKLLLLPILLPFLFMVSVVDVFENEKYFQMVMEKHGAGMDLFEYAGPELEMWSMGITLYVLTFFVNPFSDIEDTVQGQLTFPQVVSEAQFSCAARGVGGREGRAFR
ncbi:Uncharacterized protein OBRU01_04146 [Operophtera brumata]|uniref:Uncharacterized protein n=1 Tax=Operophtera brumata TaxID=104452 RepID=A0A0L7LNH7_OPEBR|nr:Uncharacterized protein OBRU01_04146 [Operophtera brumata]